MKLFHYAPTDDSSAAKSIIARHGTILRYASKTEQMFSLLGASDKALRGMRILENLIVPGIKINGSDNSNFNLNRS